MLEFETDGNALWISKDSPYLANSNWLKENFDNLRRKLGFKEKALDSSKKIVFLKICKQICHSSQGLHLRLKDR